MKDEIIQKFMDAVYDGHGSLALASFNEAKALADATEKINALKAELADTTTEWHREQECSRYAMRDVVAIIEQQQRDLAAKERELAGTVEKLRRLKQHGLELCNHCGGHGWTVGAVGQSGSGDPIPGQVECSTCGGGGILGDYSDAITGLESGNAALNELLGRVGRALNDAGIAGDIDPNVYGECIGQLTAEVERVKNHRCEDCALEDTNAALKAEVERLREYYEASVDLDRHVATFDLQHAQVDRLEKALEAIRAAMGK